jgi:exopolysaccharide biosynthesis WecB/TagA/CpsF family protein
MKSSIAMFAESNSSPESPPVTVEPPLSVVLGLPFHRTTMEETLADCERFMDGDEPRYLVTPNLDITRLAANDSRLRRILFAADRVICDGKPLLWLSRRQKMALPERVAGSDLTPRLLERCAEGRRSVFFFGSDEATLEKAAAVLAEQHPNLTVSGWASPPLAAMDDWDNDGFVAQIREAKPDLLLVALGCPKQEFWIEKYQRVSGVPLAIGIGASLDFIAGKQVRAPRFLQAIGMEWFWRFANSPRRLGGRYAADFKFLMRQWLKIPAAGHQVLLLPETPMRGADGGIVRVTDCAAVVKPSADFLALIATRWRTAEAAGEGMSLKRVHQNVADQLQRFGWDQLMHSLAASEPTKSENSAEVVNA